MVNKTPAAHFGKTSPTHICHGPSRPACDTAIRLLSVIIPQKPIDTRHILILQWKIGRHGVTFHRVLPIFLQVPLLSFEALDSHPLWPHIAKGVAHFLIRTKMGMKPGEKKEVVHNPPLCWACGNLAWAIDWGSEGWEDHRYSHFDLLEAQDPENYSVPEGGGGSSTSKQIQFFETWIWKKACISHVWLRPIS